MGCRLQYDTSLFIISRTYSISLTQLEIDLFQDTTIKIFFQPLLALKAFLSFSFSLMIPNKILRHYLREALGNKTLVLYNEPFRASR